MARPIRLLALGSGILGLAGLFLLAPRQPPLVATLQTEDAALVYEVRHLGATLTITRTAGTAAAEGHVHQLWLLAPDAAPVSLGLLAEGPLSVAYPMPPRGWSLAVSIEPTGGNPVGAPGGPILLTTTIGG